MVSRRISGAINYLTGNRRTQAGAVCDSPHVQRDKVLETLNQDGFCSLPPAPVATVRKIVEYFQSKPAQSNLGTTLAVPANSTDPSIGSAAYSMETVLGCQEVVDLISESPALQIATEYLGCTPTLSSLGVRWSFASDKPNDTQRFHRDVDDWRFLKLFIYLSDVDVDSGPHVYVRGSHLTSGTLRARLYGDGDLVEKYGVEKFNVVTGPAGTTFLADTFGFHMGRVPTVRARLILQAQFSLLPIFAFLYNPVKIQPKSSLDPYVTRLLIST
jgi:hypothetical protein